MNRLFSFVLGVFLATEAGAGEWGDDKDGIALVVEALAAGNRVMVKLANSSEEKRPFVSDLPQRFSHRFADLPESGGLQLRDINGKTIKVTGQNPEGWWYPAILKSSVSGDPKLSELEVPAGETLTYSVDATKAVELARRMSEAKGKTPVAAFRVRFGFMLPGGADGRRVVFAESDWIPYEEK